MTFESEETTRATARAESNRTEVTGMNARLNEAELKLNAAQKRKKLIINELSNDEETQIHIEC